MGYIKALPAVYRTSNGLQGYQVNVAVLYKYLVERDSSSVGYVQ